MGIGKIERIKLRDIWKHEAYDFSNWLQDNIDVINDATGLNLSSPETEKSAGSFNVDIVAEDESGNPVIIENQLEKSNHDHLGKVITYLTSIDAKIAIWIVAEARPEHIKAISWLNESAGADFYLFKVEGIKIGNSEPAPLLTLIVGPSEESKEMGVKKKELAERYTIRLRFWELLLEKLKGKTKLHSQISPTQHNWLGTSAGLRGLGYNYVITKHETSIELYIDKRKDSDEENKKIFDNLFQKKTEIEKSFGGSLNWQSLEGKRACRIGVKFTTGGYRDEESWETIQDNLIGAMIRFEKVLKPFVSRLRV